MTTRSEKMLYSPSAQNNSPIFFPSSMVMDALSVAEAAALACEPWIGRGDEKAADQAAVQAMRAQLNQLPIKGKVVIGEGERDEAPMLYIGEEVGNGKGTIQTDIALDPLEGTTLCAHAASGAMATLAFATPGNLLHAPDVYMEKMAIGVGYPQGLLDLDRPLSENIRLVATHKGVKVEELRVMMLDRPRHASLLAELRKIGVKVHLIKDGDVAAVLLTSLAETPVDIYVGTGGAPEGVLAAAALTVLGGQMVGRLLFHHEHDKERAFSMGIKDIHQQFQLQDMARGDIIFVATGVTSGNIVRGITMTSQARSTHSIVMHAATRTIRMIETIHPIF